MIGTGFWCSRFSDKPKSCTNGFIRNIWRKMNEMVPQMNRASAQQGGLGLFHIGTNYLPESSGYHLVVPTKWFIATKWGTVYTCTIQMLYFFHGFSRKTVFFHPRKQLFLTASVFPTTAWLSENYMFEIAFLPDQTAFFPDPDWLNLTHGHTGQTTTYFLQKNMVETTKTLVFSNSNDFARMAYQVMHGTSWNHERTTIWWKWGHWVLEKNPKLN